MAINFKNFSSGINFGSLPSDPSGGENGDVYYNTTINAFRGFQNGIWQNLISNGGSVSAFLNAASNPISTSGSISGSVGTWQTFPNSPSFTFVPSVTGTYKIYCSMPLTPGPGNNVAFLGRIVNTSGGATLLQESQVLAIGFDSGVTDPGFSGYAQSTYSLIAGTTYVFDLQGQVTSSGTLTLGGGTFYMFAEGVSLQGTLNTTGSSYNVFTSNIVNTLSSPVTSPTFETFDNSPAFTFTPAITGTYKVYAGIPLNASTVDDGVNARIFNTSGGAILLAESDGANYFTGGSASIATVFIQSLYSLVAGTTYIFDIQGSSSSSGQAYLDARVNIGAPFYMFAEGIGLNNNSSQFPVKMKAFGSFSGSGNIVFTNISYDSNSAYNTSTGEYTIPYDGDYVAGFSAQSSSGGIIAIPLVNGALPNGAPAYFFDTSGQNGDIAAANVHMSCKKGDVVTWSSSSSTAYNSNSSLWIYSVSLAQGLVGPQGSSGGSAFAYYASNVVNTINSGQTSTSFVNFDNSPAFTFTPTISGIYKVYSSIPFQVSSSNTFGLTRIFNTSGGATLLQESQSTMYSASGAPEISNQYVQSTYILNAGTTYVFDIQGQTDTGGLWYDRGDHSPFYIFAEGISLSPVLASPVGVVTTQFGVDPTTTSTLATTADSPVIFPFVYFDTTNSYNATSGQYTAPVAGYYDVNCAAFYFGGNQNDIYLVVNGNTIAGRLVQGVSASVQSGGIQVYLNYGDVLTIVPDASFAFSYTALSTPPSTNSGYIPTVTISLRPPTPAIQSRMVKSLSTGVFAFSGGPTPVLDSGGVNPIFATVACQGGDVEVGLMSDGTTNPACVFIDTVSAAGATVSFWRDGVQIDTQQMSMQTNLTYNLLSIPASSFKFIDTPPPGSHTYTVQVSGATNRGDQGVYYAVLYARVLA